MARSAFRLEGILDPSATASGLLPEVALELPSELRAIEAAVDYVMRRCEGCQEDVRRLRLNFRVGLTEALANAMLYGNGRDPSKRVRVEVYVRNCAVVARVTDEGNGFDPDRVPDPTAQGNLLREGGRGLFLMRRLLDEVHFNDRGNSVTLVLHRSVAGVLQGGAPA